MAFREIGTRRIAEPAVIAALLAVISMLLPPLGVDQAAQEFRTELFERSGPAIWNNLWFGGHYLPGYSVLAPPLGSVFGPRLMGGLAVIASAAAFAVIAYREWGEKARPAVLWFAAAAAISLYTGRLTFALGVAVALAAVLCLQNGWRAVGLLAACLVTLASPVASLFLACGGVAWWLGGRGRGGLELAVASFLSALLAALLFPGGGDMPFAFTSFLPTLVLTLVVLAVVPAEEKVIRMGLMVYAAALLASFVLSTPMGGNATRLGALLLGPVLVVAAWDRRRWAVFAIVPAIVVWQAIPAVRDLESSGAEASSHERYFEPLLAFLEPRIRAAPARVEVLPLANHWEAAYVAERVPISRGWERQSDRRLNPLFYEEEIAPAAYRRWLDELSVAYVAVPDAPLDYAAESEAKLIERGVPYLSRVMDRDGWTVFRVEGARPMAERPARLTSISSDAFTVATPAAGSFVVRIRYTPYWSIVRGDGCVSESANGFTMIRFRRPGSLRVRADFSPMRVLAHDESCSN